MELVECVPNFSEGKNQATLDAIAAAIRSVEGVELLDMDPGVDTNRCVVTFIGHPEAVLKAAFASIRVASQLIDMSTHKGAHARMGACDVCPLVPVRGISMGKCAQLAKRLGARVADELAIPVYLYEEAASRPERRNLASVRSGEYEGLPDKLKDPDWVPDFGKATFNKTSGATAIGAREFLIAYNFNLNTRDRKIAHDIALCIREAGRAKRDQAGRIIRDDQGKAIKTPGLFKHVKAVGWTMDDFNCAQISMNLTNYKKTSLGEVFDQVSKLAEERGVRCTGSELVGLLPKECLLGVGRHYLRKAGKCSGWPEKELVRVAVQSLGLSELYPFEADKKIIENRIPDERPLANMKLIDFVDETSIDSPAPGGGSIAAICGALAAALAGMAAHLTVGRKGYEQVREEMAHQTEQAQELKDFFLRAIDDDTAAFNEVMAALRLPKKTPSQKQERKTAIQKSTHQAIDVPFSVLTQALKAIGLAEQSVDKANSAALSDAGVAGLCARTAAEGAFYNVAINLPGLDDKQIVARMYKEAKEILDDIRQRTQRLSEIVQKKLESELMPLG
jgi:glutamate formiminotransferase/formiminotetrahydrofolate cyclodeaminase